MNKYDYAIKYFDKCLANSINTKDSEALYWKAQCYHELKDYEKAKALFVQLVDYYPNSPNRESAEKFIKYIEQIIVDDALRQIKEEDKEESELRIP